jgi:hypothetical protein
MSGDVEMFWVEQGQLLMAAVPVADGIDDGQFVNGHYDHDPYWATVQRTHMHLWDVEYFHVPRGRVLFNKAEDRFNVYLDKVLCTNPIKRMILAHFHLPRKHTIFRTDLHDTTDPDDLDRLCSSSPTSTAAAPTSCLCGGACGPWRGHSSWRLTNTSLMRSGTPSRRNRARSISRTTGIAVSALSMMRSWPHAISRACAWRT